MAVQAITWALGSATTGAGRCGGTVSSRLRRWRPCCPPPHPRAPVSVPYTLTLNPSCRTPSLPGVSVAVKVCGGVCWAWADTSRLVRCAVRARRAEGWSGGRGGCVPSTHTGTDLHHTPTGGARALRFASWTPGACPDHAPVTCTACLLPCFLACLDRPTGPPPPVPPVTPPPLFVACVWPPHA